MHRICKTHHDMKPSYAISALLCAICFISCESNNPESEKETHQPANPATWSPNGKTYVCSTSDYNPHDYAYFINSIEFIKYNEAFVKGTTYSEYPIPSEGEFSRATNYTCEYPNVIINGVDSDGYSFVFVDTLTLRSVTWNKDYHLQRQ